MSARGWETAPPAPVPVDAVTNLTRPHWNQNQFAANSHYHLRQRVSSRGLVRDRSALRAGDGATGFLLCKSASLSSPTLLCPPYGLPGCLIRKRHHGKGNLYFHNAA